MWFGAWIGDELLFSVPADSKKNSDSRPVAPLLVEPIVGIDLGTTNSLVAVASWPLAGSAAERSPRILADESGRKLLPSVVRFEPGGRAVVGHEARDAGTAYPLSTVASVKRLMGRSLADAAADLTYLSYAVVEGAGNTARVSIPMVGGEAKVVTPQEVSAVMLAALRDRAEAALGVPVRKAVITVPAYFDDSQRQATRDAGRLAGLEVVRIVAEPTAAALAYGLGLRAGAGAGVGAGLTDQIIVVYDFGGGTFDVSVLRLVAGGSDGGGAGGAGGGGDGGDGGGGNAMSGSVAADAFQVLATSGDTHLGGDDIDHLLIDVLVRELCARFGMEAGELSPGLKRELAVAAERAKVVLSSAETAEVFVQIDSVRSFRREIGREEFDTLIGPLIERTLECCRRAMRDAKKQLAGEAVGAVVMVGGSTRIPLVRQLVGLEFGREPYTALDPDLVVALGAAVQAGVLMEQAAGKGRSAVLLDVIPLSMGIETLGGAVAKVVMRNSAVPLRAKEMFSTSIDSQTSITLKVLQGEREMAADCRELGTFYLRGIPPMPAGIPQVRVEFAVDVSGILSVSAVELRSGKRAAVQIVPNFGLSSEEIERIERESVVHARSDMKRHRMADLVANSSLDLHWIDRQFVRHGEKLEAKERQVLSDAIANLRGFVERAKRQVALGEAGVDADAFAAAKESLDRASMRLHEISITESLRV